MTTVNVEADLVILLYISTSRIYKEMSRSCRLFCFTLMSNFVTLPYG